MQHDQRDHTDAIILNLDGTPPPAATSLPPTLEDLLLEGRRILAERRVQQQREEAAIEQLRQERWIALLEVLEATFGELMASLPALPPDDFDGRAKVKVELRPFGNVGLSFHARPTSESWQWKLLIDGDDAYEVETGFSPLTLQALMDHPEDELPRPRAFVRERVSNLAEAVALCHESETSFARAVQAQRDTIDHILVGDLSAM